MIKQHSEHTHVTDSTYYNNTTMCSTCTCTNSNNVYVYKLHVFHSIIIEILYTCTCSFSIVIIIFFTQSVSLSMTHVHVVIHYSITFLSHLETLDYTVPWCCNNYFPYTEC